MEAKPELTIVVPTKNEEKEIGNLLDSVLGQDYQCITSTPIFVADFRSIDRTRQVVQEYGKRLNISIIEGGLPSVGRNRGAAQTKSRYILFLDADIRLDDPTTVRRIIELADEKNLQLAATPIHCPTGSWLDKFFYGLSNFAQQLSRFTKPYATGQFMLFERRAFEEIGGFDEQIKYAEDVFLTRQVPRARFAVLKDSVSTGNRRFLNTGYLRVLLLALGTVFSQVVGYKKWFYTDHRYFD